MEMGKPLITATHEGVLDALTTTTIRAFGPRWTNPMAHVPTVRVPVGVACGGCERALTHTDMGLTLPLVGDVPGAVVAFHRECWLRSITGPPASEHAWDDETTD